jgi:hypothetical protein
LHRPRTTLHLSRRAERDGFSPVSKSTCTGADRVAMHRAASQGNANEQSVRTRSLD